jgi:hypothetical protein
VLWLLRAWLAGQGTDGPCGRGSSTEANPLLSRYGDSHPVKWNGLSIQGSLPARGFSITDLSRIGEKQHLLTRVPVRGGWGVVGLAQARVPGSPSSPLPSRAAMHAGLQTHTTPRHTHNAGAHTQCPYRLHKHTDTQPPHLNTHEPTVDTHLHRHTDTHTPPIPPHVCAHTSSADTHPCVMWDTHGYNTATHPKLTHMHSAPTHIHTTPTHICC